MPQFISLRVSFSFNGQEGVARAKVPFETGRHELPSCYPFNRNVYVGPDAGYSLNWIDVNAEERTVTLAYAQRVTFDEQGKAVLDMQLAGEPLHYEFEIR